MNGDVTKFVRLDIVLLKTDHRVDDGVYSHKKVCNNKGIKLPDCGCTQHLNYWAGLFLFQETLMVQGWKLLDPEMRHRPPD